MAPTLIHPTSPQWQPVHYLEPPIIPPTSPFIPIPTSILKLWIRMVPLKKHAYNSQFKLLMP